MCLYRACGVCTFVVLLCVGGGGGGPGGWGDLGYVLCVDGAWSSQKVIFFFSTYAGLFLHFSSGKKTAPAPAAPAAAHAHHDSHAGKIASLFICLLFFSACRLFSVVVSFFFFSFLHPRVSSVARALGL